ncbi:MAG: ribosome small subunit-dependent GTPase A [Burkholderiaceae bacterium]|nr:ribosome small subunit-dependent GTPase A [Burkholderiaceae bacterium]
MRARILSHHGRQAWVVDAQGAERLCVFKGRDHQPATNDQVEMDPGPSPAVITEILPRQNAVMRSEAHRTKVLAANIDQAVIVISGSPLFSDELLARMICACCAEDIDVIIALNKIDLADDTTRARAQLAPFTGCLALLEVPVIEIAAQASLPDANTGMLDQLSAMLASKTSLVMGQSGMGKSSLLNRLIPEFQARTNEISSALQTGKHTTTAARMMAYREGWLIDTPGFQLFGLHHLSEQQIALGFPEWRAAQDVRGRCRFANCHHINEPGCTVCDAASDHPGQRRRLALWQDLIRAS